MRKLILLTALLFLSGCQALQTVGDYAEYSINNALSGNGSGSRHHQHLYNQHSINLNGSGYNFGGRSYQYNLNNVGDRIRYSNDTGAQIRNSLDVRGQIERETGAHNYHGVRF